MPLPTDERALSLLFERLGARDPDLWAASQAREGINQVHRFVFLKQAWAAVVDSTDDSWIDRVIANHDRWPQRADYELGATLKRLLACGASRRDLAQLVRAQQVEVLFAMCYLLSDPAIEDPALADVAWCLVETDEEGRPTTRSIDLLHESVGETDPAARP